MAENSDDILTKGEVIIKPGVGRIRLMLANDPVGKRRLDKYSCGIIKSGLLYYFGCNGEYGIDGTALDIRAFDSVDEWGATVLTDFDAGNRKVYRVTRSGIIVPDISVIKSVGRMKIYDELQLCEKMDFYVNADKLRLDEKYDFSTAKYA